MCFDGGKILTAADVAGKPFLPGGIGFALSCYGGATPAVSAYHRWLKALRQNNAYRESADDVLEGLPREGESPFVAALPQTLLANPQGPLAIIAHADLAWSCAFDELGSSESHTERFAGLVAGVVNANRVGTAFYDLYRFFSETNTELTTRYDTDETDQARDWLIERSRLWMLRNDLAGYLLLGDPAVRFSVAGTGKPVASRKTNPQSTSDKARRFIVMGTGAATPTAPIRVEDAVREQAVLAVLGGEDAQRVATRMHLVAEDVTRWTAAYQEAGRNALRNMP